LSIRRGSKKECVIKDRTLLLRGLASSSTLGPVRRARGCDSSCASTGACSRVRGDCRTPIPGSARFNRVYSSREHRGESTSWESAALRVTTQRDFLLAFRRERDDPRASATGLTRLAIAYFSWE
jgi:hypothetical protein